MPTGYTSDLYDRDDVTFRAFTLRCARAFGAMYAFKETARDREVTPDDFTAGDSWHHERLAVAREELAKARKMGADEALAIQDKLRRERKAAIARERDERGERLTRFQAMLTRVQAWEPPSPDHTRLKVFMEEQLGGEIDFLAAEYTVTEPPKLTAQEYKKQLEAKAEEDIDYHEREIRKAEENARSNREWYQALWDALAPPEKWAADDAKVAYEPRPSWMVDDEEDEEQTFWAPSGYGPIVQSLAPQVLVEVEDDEYQGYTRLLLGDGNRRGWVIFGWGSCSGCDALQAANSWEEVAEIRNKLYSEIEWRDSAEELLKSILEKDWAGTWSFHQREGKAFLFKTFEALGHPYPQAAVEGLKGMDDAY